MKNFSDKSRVLFSRTLFKGLFLSYIVIIFLCMAFYSCFLFYENYVINRERSERKAMLMLEEADGIMKERVLIARNIVTELTYSTVLKKLYLNKVAGTALDSTTYGDINDEISKTKTVNGLSVDGTIIFLNQENRAYASGGVVTLGDAVFQPPQVEFPHYEVGTLVEILELGESNRYLFNKEYFVYLDCYTYQNRSDVGVICILFNLDVLRGELARFTENSCGVSLNLHGQEVMCAGSTKGTPYQEESSALQGVDITVYVSRESLRGRDLFTAVMMLLLLFGVSCISIGVAYWFSRRNYKVIGDIEQLVHSEGVTGRRQESRYTAEEEREYIVNGIQKMIGEKNGYQEKMITIAPYGKTGMLQRILAGNADGNAVQVLREEYPDLIKPFFIAAIANLAYGSEIGEGSLKRLARILERAESIFTSEEISLLYYYRDVDNIFFVVSIDSDEIEDDFFYRLHQYLENSLKEDGCEVTMGVDCVRDNLVELKEAYEGALRALDYMIIDGRGVVYFKEEEGGTDEYYLPDSFREKLGKAIKKGRAEEICGMLDDIREKNRSRSGAAGCIMH